jgi:uncharacterized membrane protein
MSSYVETDPQPAGRPAASRISRISVRDDVVLGAAAVAMGLLAGLFYAFACAIVPGLHASSDRTVVEAMQNINEGIENPVFFATFLGAPALAVWALVAERRRGSPAGARWVAAGLVLYAVCFLVTMAANIPLNETLADAGDPAHIADIAQVRDDFETPWVVWNIVRTVAVAAAFGCLTRAVFLRRGREG